MRSHFEAIDERLHVPQLHEQLLALLLAVLPQQIPKKQALFACAKPLLDAYDVFQNQVAVAGVVELEIRVAPVPQVDSAVQIFEDVYALSIE